MTKTPSKKNVIYLLIIVFLLLGTTGLSSAMSITSFSPLQFVDNDGFLEEDNEELQVVDFKLEKTVVSEGTNIESRLIVGNYGDDNIQDMKFNIDITRRSDGTSHSDILQYPEESYETDINAGQNRQYRHIYNFTDKQQGIYEIKIYRNDQPTDMPVSRQSVRVIEGGERSSDKGFDDRSNSSKRYISVQKFKDENSYDSSLPLSTVDIPPIQTINDGEVDEIDAGVGSVVSFNNIRDNSTSEHGTIRRTGSDIKTGFYFDGIENRNHYGLRLRYKLSDSPDLDELEVDIVDSSGFEIDDNTTYRLYDRGNDKIKTVNYHLSSKEYNYVSNRSQVYVVLNGEDFNGNIDLYSMEIISANDVYQVDRDDLQVNNLNIEPSNPKVGERVSVTADIRNTGGQSIQRDFSLYESSDGFIDKSIGVSKTKIINPGQSKTVSYSIVIGQSTSDEFKILDETIDVNIGTDDGTSTINPSLSASPQLVGSGQNVDFTVTGFTISQSRIDRVEWDKNSNGNIEYTNTDLSNTMTFSSTGSKTVTANIYYENTDGNMVQDSISASVDVISEPQPDLTIGKYYLSVNEQNNIGGQLVSSALRGEIYSETCMGDSCSSSFNYKGEQLPTTHGINMLVFKTDWKDKSYNTVHYGMYQTHKNDGTSSRIQGEITESKIESLQGGLDGSSGDPSQRLVNDIDSYTSQSGEYYMILFSGGDTKPEVSESTLYNKLDDIEVNIGKNCEMGTGQNCVFEDNSMWMHMAKINTNSVIPLYERYKPPESSSDNIYKTFDLSPKQASGDLPPKRNIYYDITDTEVVGGLDDPDTEIEWIFTSGSPVSGEKIIQKKYDSITQDQVTIRISDQISSNSDSELITGVNIETNSPNVGIENDEIKSGNKGSIYASQSYDSDSSIVDYSWDITDPDGEDLGTFKGYQINRTWSKSGEYNVELTATDYYGNTATSQKTIDVGSGVPEADVDIRRVSGELTRNNYQEYNLLVQPSVHYTFEKNNGKYYDITGNTVVTTGNSLPEGTSTDYNSVSINSGSDSKIVIDEDSSLNHREFTLSTWIKSDNIKNVGEIIKKQGQYELSISNNRLMFNDNQQQYVKQDIELNEDEWNHIAISLGVDMNMYLNGNEVYDTISSNTPNIESSGEMILGDNNQKSMDLNDLRIYGTPLSDKEVNSIYNWNPNFGYTGGFETTIYEDGSEYVGFDTNVNGNGNVDKKTNKININLDSTSGSDSTGYVRTQDKIDLGKYNEIYMEYDRKYQRNKVTGQNEAGYVSLHILEPDTSYGTPGDNRGDEINGFESDAVDSVAVDRKSGIMSLDVSDYTSERKITVFAKSHGSNRGLVSVNISEIWLSTFDSQIKQKSDLFDNGLYPEKSDGVTYYPTRDGVGIKSVKSPSTSRLVSNLYQSPNNMLSYSIHGFDSGGGYNIYAETDGGYSLEEQIGSTVSIACSPSNPTDTICRSDGKKSDRLIKNNQYAESAISARTDIGGNIEYKKLRVSGDNSNNEIPTVVFDARDSSADGDRNIVEFNWDIDPRSNFNTDKKGPIMRHKFDSEGQKTVELQIVDSKGDKSIKEYSLNVGNTAPEVSVITRQTTKAGDEVSFNIDTSNVETSNIEEIKLLPGNGDSVKTTDPTSNIEYTYEKSGVYKYVVVVADSNGLTGAYQGEIKVRNNLPDISVLNSGISAHVKDTIFLDATRDGTVSNDPEAVTERYDATDIHETYNGELEFTWTLPDGTTVNSPTASFMEDELIDPSDPKIIELTVENEQGITLTKEIELTTYNSGPEIAVSASGNDQQPSNSAIASAYPGQSFEFVFTATHPHPRMNGQVDITIANEPYSETMNSGYSSYTYQKSYTPNSFPTYKDISATVTDEYGATNSFSNQIEIVYSGITVNRITSSDGTEVKAYEPVTYTAHVSAESTRDEDLKYEFQFTDGTNSGRQDSNTYEHALDEVGTNTLTVIATDTNLGFSDQKSITIESKSTRETCKDIHNVNPNLDSGNYELEVDDTTSRTINAYCDMEYDGGGWTLVMKIADGKNDKFIYSSDYWSNDAVFNQSAKNMKYDKSAKFKSYNLVEGTEIRADFKSQNHQMEESFDSPQTAKEIFTTTKEIGFESYYTSKHPPCKNSGVGKYGDYWYNHNGEDTSISSSNSIFAHQCGRQQYGFDISTGDPGFTGSKVRWGWNWQNERGYFNSQDAIAGIGMSNNGDVSLDTTVGSQVTCCSSKSQGEYPEKALIWVR